MASLFQRIVAQINPFDQGATFKNPTPQRRPAPQPQRPAPQQQGPRVNVQQLAQALSRLPAGGIHVPQINLPHIGMPHINTQNIPGQVINLEKKIIGQAARTALPQPLQAPLTILRQPQVARAASTAIGKVQIPRQIPGSSFINTAVVRPMVKTEQNVLKINQGQNPYTGTRKQQAGQALQDIINVASVVPVGKGVSVGVKAVDLARAGEAGKGISTLSKVRTGAASGAKIGGGFGAAQGVSTGLQQNQTPGQIARTTAISTGIGTIGGGVLGGGIPLTGAGISKGAQITKQAGQKAITGLKKLPKPTPLGQGGYVNFDGLSKEEQNLLKKQGFTPDVLQKATLTNAQGQLIPQTPQASKTLYHETGSNNLDQLIGIGDVNGLNVSTDRSLALGQGGKGILIEFNKDKLLGNGYLKPIKKPGTGFTGQKEFEVRGGRTQPGSIKSITIKNGTPLTRLQEVKLSRKYDRTIDAKGNSVFTPKTQIGKTPTRVAKINKSAKVISREEAFTIAQTNPKELANAISAGKIVVEQPKNQQIIQPPIMPTVKAPVGKQITPTVKPPSNASSYTKSVYNSANSTIKEPSWIRRALTTSNGIISRFGEPGMAIATKINNANMRSKQLQQRVITSMPSVMKLGKNDFVKFVDTLDARSAGQDIPMSPKIAKAVEEWNKTMPTIVARARNAGIDMGDLGPNYFPRFYKDIMNNSGFNRAAQKLVDNGQAANIGEAQRILGRIREDYVRPFGNLEKSRISADLPYEKNHDAMVNYLNRATKRISNAEQFGPQNQILDQLRSDVANQGIDIGPQSVFTKNLETSLGLASHNPFFMKLANRTKAFNAFTQLGLAGISNLSQPVNTAIVGGVGRSLQGVSRYGIGSVSKKLGLANKSTQALDRAISQGTTLEHSITDITAQMLGTRGKVASFVVSPLFRQIERFNRTHTAIVSEIYGNALAKKAAAGNKQAQRLLTEKLGVTGKINQKLSSLQLSQAANGLDKLAQFHVDPGNLPAWMDTPLGKVISQFSQYPYKQTQLIYNHVLLESIKGNPAPLLRFLTIAPAAGLAVSESRRIVSGKPSPEGETSQQKYIRGVSAIGGLGLPVQYAQNLVQGAKFNTPLENALSTFGGPTGSLLTELSQAGKKAQQGNLKPLEKAVVRRIPLVGKPIAGRAFPTQKQEIDKKVAAGKFNELTPEQKLIATYKKPEESKFLNMTEKQKQEAIKKNPALQDLYNRIQADKVHFRADKEYKGLDKTSSATLNKFNKMTKEEKVNEAYSNKKADYELALAKFNYDKTQPGWTRTKELKRRVELNKIQTESNFDKTTRDIYGLSKPELALYLANDPNADKTKSDLLALDNTLKNAGAIKNRKFAKGIGTSGGSGGGTGKSTGGKVKVAKMHIPKAPKTRVIKIKEVKAKKIAGTQKVKIPKVGKVKRIKIA